MELTVRTWLHRFVSHWSSAVWTKVISAKACAAANRGGPAFPFALSRRLPVLTMRRSPQVEGCDHDDEENAER